jgi:hypothetical protein
MTRARAMSAAGSAVRLWEAHTHKARGSALRDRSGVADVAFSPDGRILATAGDKRNTRAAGDAMDADDDWSASEPHAARIDRESDPRSPRQRRQARNPCPQPCPGFGDWCLAKHGRTRPKPTQRPGTSLHTAHL